LITPLSHKDNRGGHENLIDAVCRTLGSRDSPERSGPDATVSPRDPASPFLTKITLPPPMGWWLSVRGGWGPHPI